MSARMYCKGKQITTIAEFEKCKDDNFVVMYGTDERTTNRAFMISWPYRLVENFIHAGRIYNAVKKGGRNIE